MKLEVFEGWNTRITCKLRMTFLSKRIEHNYHFLLLHILASIFCSFWLMKIAFFAPAYLDENFLLIVRYKTNIFYFYILWRAFFSRFEINEHFLFLNLLIIAHKRSDFCCLLILVWAFFAHSEMQNEHFLLLHILESIFSLFLNLLILRV